MLFFKATEKNVYKHVYEKNIHYILNIKFPHFKALYARNLNFIFLETEQWRMAILNYFCAHFRVLVIVKFVTYNVKGKLFHELTGQSSHRAYVSLALQYIDLP